jgi:hypothetical protein
MLAVTTDALVRSFSDRLASRGAVYSPPVYFRYGIKIVERTIRDGKFDVVIREEDIELAKLLLPTTTKAELARQFRRAGLTLLEAGLVIKCAEGVCVTD